VNPNDQPESRKLLHEAMSLHRAGRLDEAEQRYAAFLALEPQHAQALRLCGVLAREQGNGGQALSLLQRACTAAPEDAEAAAELGLCYLTTGELLLAEKALRDAVRLAPDHLRALANLGALLQYRGHVDAAADCHRRALVLDPEDIEVRCNLVNTLLEAGRGEEALVECNAALKDSPAPALLLAARGAVLCGLHRYDEALLDLERALKSQPADDMALINLGLARRMLGEHETAVAILRTAVRINPDNARATADLVNLLAARGQMSAALSLCENFLDRHPGECLVLTVYAYALRDAGRADEARQILDLERCVRVIEPPVPAGFTDFADFNAQLGQCIENDPSLLLNPLGKATRLGGQTGELDLDAHPALQALRELINTAVRDSAEYFRRAGLATHPMMARAADRWTLRVWGTVLGPGGHQAPHMHPLGWLSGAYYVRVPRDMQPTPGMNDPELLPGALEFSRPPERLLVQAPVEVRVVAPQEGRLALFPSAFYHRTIPFTSSEKRISIAFDAMPAS
jgi:uncharacterized protein (TIGR02466 family)